MNDKYIHADHFWSVVVHMTCIVLWVKEDLSSLLYRHQKRTGLLCTPDWLHDQTGRTLFQNPHGSLVNRLVRVCVWYAARVNVCMCAVPPGEFGVTHSSMPQGHEDRLVSKYDILSLGTSFKMTERMHVFMCIRVTVRLIAKEGKKERDFQLYSLSVTGDYQRCLSMFKQHKFLSVCMRVTLLQIVHIQCVVGTDVCYEHTRMKVVIAFILTVQVVSFNPEKNSYEKTQGRRSDLTISYVVLFLFPLKQKQPLPSLSFSLSHSSPRFLSHDLCL